jgi:hypothetical protein
MNRSLVRAAACTLAAAAVTAALLAVPASTPSQAATFTLSDSNCSSFNWDSGTNTLTCVTSGGGGGGALSCSILLSNGSPTVSTAETVTANCSGATGTVTYTWTAAAGNVSGCQPIVQRASPSQNVADVAAPGGSTALNCTYNLSANDSGTNTTSTPSKGISYSTGGGGGGGNIVCNMPNGGATHVVNATWGTSQLYYSVNIGGFGPNDAIVVKFTTSSITTATGKGSISAVEYADPQAPRTGALSASPCDFGASALPLKGGGVAAFANDTAPYSYFSLVNPKTGTATLQANTTYYWSIENSSCPSGSCNVLITFNKVPGT